MWWISEVEENVPECICEYATRPVCHRSQIPLRCLPNQQCLPLQTPRAHWSALCLCWPPEYPSGSASQEPWPLSLWTEYGLGYVWKKCHHHINVPRINVPGSPGQDTESHNPAPKNLAIGLWGIVSMVKHFKEFVELIGTVTQVHINHTKIYKHTEK